MDARAIAPVLIRLATALAVIVAAIAVPAVGHATSAHAATAAPPMGVVRTPGIPLNVRYGPAVWFGLVMSLRNGTRAPIHCQTYGQLIRGTVKTTALWDRLPNGRYVSDAYVDTGRTGRVAPLCPTAAPRPTPTPTPTPSSPAPPPPTTTAAPAPSPSATTSAPQFVLDAVAPARDSFREYRVPTSVTIAQAILESGWGRSLLTVNDNNYFGFKCGSGPGPIATGCRDYPTTECNAQGCYRTTAGFRVYASMTDSFRDHGRVLATLSRYRAAFDHVDDPDAFVAEVHRAGYATDPAYTDKLIRLMRLYDLYQYDG